VVDGKTGPLTEDELEALWTSVTDRSYWEPFTELGEGLGYEAHTQSFAQHGRVSQAVDETTQGLYVLPWSGQTGDPASGAAQSVAGLAFSRIGPLDQELTLVPGTLVEEIAVDFGDLGGVEVHTGRRYALTALVGVGPGVPGPVAGSAQAEAPGRGYDNPQPGTLVSVVQPGSGLTNGGASVVPGLLGHALVVDPDPDVVVPELVGQYVELVAGANAGAVRRVARYLPANPGVDGGTVVLAPTTVLRFTAGSVVGTFASGEVVEQSGWSATVLYATATHLVADRLSGSVALATTATGVGSGATATFDSVDQGPDLVAETGTATWKVLDWAADLGLAVTNPDPPSGGKLAVLDELGAERRVARGAGQDDDGYRERVSTLADVVSPNAVLRAVNRVLAPLGQTGWLREVGLAGLPGLYYDGDPTNADPAVAFAYDLDFDVRPQDRYKLVLSYLEMRAFFLVGLPALDAGDFGCAYDDGPADAYDAAPTPAAFYDGFALTAASFYRTIWQSLDEARAGGVSFDLVQDPYGPL
jgi:hypothetical protein